MTNWPEFDEHPQSVLVAVDGSGNRTYHVSLDEQQYNQARDAIAAMQWRPIETMPKGRVELMFWIRPKTNDELTAQWKKLVIQSSTREPCLSMGIYGQWSSLFTATHWMPLPPQPTDDL